ncbi:hypothetical protein Tco_0753512 [Tanacetum coccineum]
MRNIKMTMSIMQLNSKFVNNMLPEWGRFVKAVKLNGGLRDSNYDQLYAYLKQHEAYANENKMMLERFSQPNIDPLALMSNVSHQQYNSQSSTNPSSTYVPPHFADNSQLDSGLFPTDNLIENLTNTLNRGQGNNARGAGTAGYRGAQNRVGNVNPGGQENVVDEDVDEQPDVVCEHHEIHEMHDDVQPNYVADSHADYTSDSNMISYDQYIKDNTLPVNNVVAKSLTAELATYKKQVELYERQARFELTEREQKIDEQLRILIIGRIIKEENLKKELHSV